MQEQRSGLRLAEIEVDCAYRTYSVTQIYSICRYFNGQGKRSQSYRKEKVGIRRFQHCLVELWRRNTTGAAMIVGPSYPSPTENTLSTGICRLCSGLRYFSQILERILHLPV